MKPLWILVANGSRARLFSRDSLTGPLATLATVDFPEGRMKGSDLERDRQGHESSDNSCAATHFEPRTALGKKLLHEFARELSTRLDPHRVQCDFGAESVIFSDSMRMATPINPLRALSLGKP